MHRETMAISDQPEGETRLRRSNLWWIADRFIADRYPGGQPSARFPSR